MTLDLILCLLSDNLACMERGVLLFRVAHQQMTPRPPLLRLLSWVMQLVGEYAPTAALLLSNDTTVRFGNKLSKAFQAANKRTPSSNHRL
jgi:hypothetical protein